jgi:uncharacterized BrkB/YihY/UPF0761 family membrane protein
MAQDDRDYRNRSHRWEQRQDRMRRWHRLRRWLLVLGALAVAGTGLLIGLWSTDAAVSARSARKWIAALPGEYWIGSTIVVLMLAGPTCLSRLRRWRNRRARIRFEARQRARWEGHRRV